MRRLTPTLVAVASLALVVSSCTTASQDGGAKASASGDGSSPAGGVPSVDLSGVKKDDAIAAMVPDKVKSDGTLSVGADTSYAPAEFVGQDGKTPVGYDVDFAKALAQIMGLKAQTQSAKFASIIPAVGSKYDVGISSFTINPDRLKVANMISYFEAGEAYGVAKGNPQKINVKTPCGITIAVQTGTVEEEEIPDLEKKCKKAGKEANKYLKYENQTDATTATVGGKADVAWADSPVVAYAVTQTGGKIEQLGASFASAPQGVVVAKKDQKFAKAVQAATQQLMDDGELDRILTAWGNGQGGLKKAELNLKS